MPVPKENVEKNRYKKQRRWSLIGMLSKRKKFKKSQDSVDFCPYDGKINNKVAQNRYLELSKECPIEQYTCSPRQIRRCNSLQYTGQVSGHSNVTGQPKPDEWKSSLQSVNSSSASSYSDDVVAYKSRENSGQSLSCFDDEINQTKSPSVSKKVPFRCSSEIGRYQNDHKRHFKPCSAVGSKPLVGKKIPPPPPPRDPNVKATYYYRNNRLVSRESDSTYFSQGSDDDDDNVAADACGFYENQTDDGGHLAVANEPPRSRRPIQIRDVETLSSESDGSAPRTQSAEEALRELEDIYNSLGLSDEDLLDRAERRDLPTLHQNMRYQSSDELLDCSITLNRRILPKTRRSGVPDIVSDDMAYRRLNKKEPKRQNVVPAGSFLLVLPTVYNVDYDNEKKPFGEPDVTLDDVVFRNRRRHLNFFRVPDPQPPFGIPLGPVVGAAPSDYLHAVPEGRYRPSFRPRRSPDTVEDDLAFRALRKENKCETLVRRGPRFNGLSEETLLLDNGGRVTKNVDDDARWITPVKNAKTVRFAVLGGATTDCRPADDGPSLAEINPIVLSAAFALNGESLFFRCLPAGPRRLTDYNDTASLCTPDCAQLTTITIAKDRSLTAPSPALLLPRGRCDGKKPSPRVRFAAVKLKGPPNFRDLIRREYVLHGCRRHGPPESRLNAAAVQHRSDAVTATTAVNRTDRDSGSGAQAAGSACETTGGPARSAKVPESAAPAAVSTGPNRMPNRLEACLYVTDGKDVT